MRSIRIATTLIRYRWLGIIAALVAFALALPIAQQLQFNRSITAMFNPGDPTLQSYEQLQSEFGGNAVAMVVYRDADLWTNDGIARNEALTAEIAAVPGVSGVLSPSVLNFAVKQIRPGSFLSRGEPLLNRRDPVSRGFDRMFVGYTHSPDHTHGGVVAMLDPDNMQTAIAGMRTITTRMINEDVSPITDVVLVGEPVLIEEAFELIERDGVWLATLTISLLSIVVLVSLLDLRLVVLSIFVIAWSATLTQATLQLLGMELSLVSTILTAITTVITVTSVLHIGVRYRILRRRGGTAMKATAIALTLLIVPIALTCATDAAGFAALGVSRILPVRQFGTMIAIAATAVFLGLILIGPVILTIPSIQPLSRFIAGVRSVFLEPLQRLIRRGCLIVAQKAVHRLTWVSIACLAMFVFISLGFQRVVTETSFLKNFRDDSSIVRSYARVENEFGGAGVWDVLLDAPEVIDSSFLNQVRELERVLRDIDVEGARLSKVISLADADAVISRVRIMRLVSAKMRLAGMQQTMPVFYDALMTEPLDVDESGNKGRRFRLMIRSEENLDADAKMKLIAEVERVVSQSEVGKTAKVTGYYVLMARLIDQLIGDGWRCFFASGVLVWLLLVVSGRSLKRATIALLINLLPALLVISAVGLSGSKINMGSAMIAAVSIGLSIDGSVHFLASYRRKIARGRTAEQSATHAAAAIGVPMILATVALVIGFGGLSTSEFVPTATFGVLVATTLVVGTLINLTVLPSLIAWADRNQPRSLTRSSS